MHVCSYIGRFFFSFIGEHIKNWRKRYFILRKDGSFLGFRAKPEQNLSDPLNDFTVRGKKPEQNLSGPLNDFTVGGGPEQNLSGPLKDFTVRGKKPQQFYSKG